MPAPANGYERQGDLRHGEHAEAAIRPGRNAQTAARQRRGRLRRRQAGHVRQHHGREHRQSSANPQQARLHGDIERSHREACGIAADDAHERPGQQHAEDGAAPAEDQAFGKQRPPEGGRPRAERRAYRQLAFAPDGARQNQVRDIPSTR
jgi:hypothetical protein